MSQISLVAQPNHRTTLDAIETISSSGELEAVDVAAAYITSSGIYDLIQRIETSIGDSWADVEKRWLTSFDYCRTEPVALKTLRALPNSSVRVVDPETCLENGGWPRRPFHPKALLFRTEAHDHALAGSGNLSRSGLSKGVEVGLTVSIERHHEEEPTAFETLNHLREWFQQAWDESANLTVPLLSRYTKLFTSAPNLSSPTATEDDLASGEKSRGSLSGEDLRKLRVCSNFWIEAGNITRNRGPNLPGNQLMMKRLSRVFFGFEAAQLPENSPVGMVDLSFNGGPVNAYTLSYSDNKMDKLNLPIPGDLGPPAYDQEVLLFEQVGPRSFNLTLGSAANKKSWVKRSKAIDAHFKMASGRMWGVF